MNKDLCFKIENLELFSEQILVDFNGYPIFYICNSSKGHYIVLCSDIDKSEYIIVESTSTEIWQMLTQQFDMRDVFLTKHSFWFVKTGDSVEEDLVTKCPISEIDKSALPLVGAKYNILSTAVAEYLNTIEKVLYKSESFSPVQEIRDAEKVWYEEEPTIEIQSVVMDSYESNTPLSINFTLPKIGDIANISLGEQTDYSTIISEFALNTSNEPIYNFAGNTDESYDAAA